MGFLGVRIVLVSVTAAVVLGFASAGGVLYLETRDPLCTVCHTQPEVLYYKRSIDAEAGGVDLAAFHRLEEGIRCIDCHGGVGPRARLKTLVLAAGDTVQFAVGRYEQPARMNAPLANPNCRQCHDAAVIKEGFENHFHNLMDDSEAPPIFCVGCHVSHQEGEERAFFIHEGDVFPNCNRCHNVMGGPSELR